MLSARELARILHEELKAGHWGDLYPLNPGWFRIFADGDIDDLNICDDAAALGEVLERVVKRIQGGDE